MNDKKENNEDYNYIIFSVFVNLYILSKDTENKISNPIQTKNEYFFIDLKWLKDFKNKFNYQNLEYFFELYCDFENNLNNKNYINEKYNQSGFNKRKIEKEEFFKINRIFNKNIIVNNKDSFYYNNFCIINHKIIEEMKNNNFYFDEMPKEDIYIGNSNIIINNGNSGLECIFCKDYDSFNDIFLINYNTPEYKFQALDIINAHGLKYYFNMNKINEDSYKEQYIYLEPSNNRIAKVNNIKSNEKKEIFDRLSKINFNFDEFKCDYKTMVGNIEKPKTIEVKSFVNFDDKIKIGLLNLGNSCYINAVLQCLLHIPELVKYFLKNNLNEMLSPLSCVLKSLVQEIYQQKSNNNNKDIKKFNPLLICMIVSTLNKNFSPQIPNDAKDFLIYLIGRLHQELNQNPSKKTNYYNIVQNNDPLSKFFVYYSSNYNSIISHIFNWTNQVIRTCGNCRAQIISYQTFPYLILDLENTRKSKFKGKHNSTIIQKKNDINNSNNFNEWFNKIYEENENIPISLIDCIDYYYNKKNEFDYLCPYCHQFCRQVSFNRIYLSPNIFIFILNRGKNNIFSVKMNYPPILEINGYLETNKSPNNYELFGVITHLGLSGPGGHFIAFSKNPIDNKWYRYNDDKVTEADTFSIHNEGIAYILFYRFKKD